jgi:hypothetical protein
MADFRNAQWRVAGCVPDLLLNPAIGQSGQNPKVADPQQ